MPSPAPVARLRQDCLDVAVSLGVADDESFRSKVFSYLDFIEGTQVSKIQPKKLGQDDGCCQRWR